MGKGEQVGHGTIIEFMVFVLELRSKRYQCFIHEITPLHPEEVMVWFLGDLFELESFRFGPEMLGFPVRRPRKYTIGVLKTHYQFTGSNGDFYSTFKQKVQMHASELWCATEDEVRASAEALAAQRHKVPKADGRIDYESLLTPGQRGRLQEQRAAAVGDKSNFMGDLAQSASWCSPGPFIGTLVASLALFKAAFWCE